MRRAIVSLIAATVFAVLALCALPTAAQARFGSHTLRLGDFGPDVKTLQKYLNRAGYRVTPHAPRDSPLTPTVGLSDVVADRHR